MGLFSRKKRPIVAEPLDAPPPFALGGAQSVVTHLRLSDSEFGTHEEREGVFALEARIAERAAPLGCYHDGNEFGGGEAKLFTYGPDADTVFAAIEESLRGFDVRPGSYAVKRYGAREDHAAREERVELA